jgi:hypothetical protein
MVTTTLPVETGFPGVWQMERARQPRVPEVDEDMHHCDLYTA